MKASDRVKLYSTLANLAIPEELYENVFRYVDSLLDSEIVDTDRAIEKVLGLGGEEMSEGLKGDLYEWQLAMRPNIKREKPLIDVALKTEGGIIDADHTIPEGLVEVKYDPFVNEPDDASYKKTVTYMQLLLEDLGYLDEPEYGTFDEKTHNAYLRYAAKHSIYHGKPLGRSITPDIIKKMKEDADIFGDSHGK